MKMLIDNDCSIMKTMTSSIVSPENKSLWTIIGLRKYICLPQLNKSWTY